jgi:DNA-binding transcriptional regulator GbsR (MarR family)
MLTEMSRQDDYVKTAIRLPRDLHRKLISDAAENERSLNAEMIERLSASDASGSIAEQVAKLTRVVSALERAIKKR